MIRAFLYDAQGRDEEIAPPEAGLGDLPEHQLLWIDVEGREPGEIAALAQRLELSPRSVADIEGGARTFSLVNYGGYVHFDVAALDQKERGQAQGLKLSRSVRLDVAVGPGWLLTVHDRPLQFLEDFRDQDRGETLIGALTSAALAVSLLDWHLAAYLTALDEVESFADRVDVRMLSRPDVGDKLLEELVSARRYISSLRRSLAPQSAVFYGLSRPDFALIADSGDVNAYKDLGRRFERALDAIEHGRDLIQSSFNLFTTRTAETTNTLIRRLTFLSLMLGALGGVAGVFGMNFQTPYQKAGVFGFWAVVLGYLAFTLCAAVVARWRKWI